MLSVAVILTVTSARPNTATGFSAYEDTKLIRAQIEGKATEIGVTFP